MRTRRATSSDLPALVEFVIEQVKEGEAAIKSRDLVRQGVARALEDDSLGMYWVLVDDDDTPIGCASALKEWSDWNAGHYWWLQSMYIPLIHRGKGGMRMLVDAIKAEMNAQGGLQLRLYVNKDNRQAKRAYERLNFRLSVYEVMMMVEED